MERPSTAGPKESQAEVAPPGAAVGSFLTKPELLRLYDYWCAKRRGRTMPAMRDIDPLEIPWALSRVALMDYDPATGFRYRLTGGDLAAVYGRANLKDLTFRDILSPENATLVEERWKIVVEQPSIACMKGMVYLASDRTPIGERVLLPLADDPDGPATGLIGMTVCEWLAGEVPQEAKLSEVTYFPVHDIP